MLKKLFTCDLYVRVYKNRFVLRLLDGSSREQSFDAEQAFTSTRLLVSQFMIAETCLKKAITSAVKRGWLTPSPRVLIQPMEMVEGGLGDIEERIFRELALGAGARKAALWLSPEPNVSSSSVLSDAEVEAKLKSAV